MKERIATYQMYLNRLLVNLRRDKREIIVFAPPVTGEPEGCLCFGPRCGHADADHDQAVTSIWLLSSVAYKK